MNSFVEYGQVTPALARIPRRVVACEKAAVNGTRHTAFRNLRRLQLCGSVAEETARPLLIAKPALAKHRTLNTRFISHFSGMGYMGLVSLMA